MCVLAALSLSSTVTDNPLDPQFLKLVLFMRQNFYKSPTSYKSLGRANATLGGIKEITVEMLAAAIVAVHLPSSSSESSSVSPGVST